MIWVIGGKGMLGQELCAKLQREGLPYVMTDLECDVTAPGQLQAFATGRNLSWIVNCSAYTAVDRAEDEEVKAHLINATGAANIAATAAAIGARMIHISTDYVFAGTATRPYTEDDAVAPVGAYGRTKAAGEDLVRRHCPASFILRTAWLYGRHGNNFVCTMLRLMKERSELSVVADQWGSPTWTSTLCGVIVELIRRNATAFGIYHVTDEGQTTWHEFASEIRILSLERGLLAREIPIQPIRTDQYPTKAKRPLYSVLSKEKICTYLGRELPGWRASLAHFLDSLKETQGE